MTDIAASPPPDRVGAVRRALSVHGLLLRGGFHAASRALAAEAGHAEPAEDRPVTLLLVGNAGGAMWRAFAPSLDGAPHPLDRWTKRVIDALAAEAGALAIYPFDKPAPPFQRWAQRAEPVAPSPLGLLVHPVYGLWHAYRAALVLDGALSLPEQPAVASPCETCADRPCLSACPVGAFAASGYDVPACAKHLASAAGGLCVAGGCRARDACPVGRGWRYPDAQIAFHMEAFGRAVAPLGR